MDEKITLQQISDLMDEKFESFAREVFLPAFNNLESRMINLESRMISLEIRMMNLESRMDSLEARVSSIEQEISKIRFDLDWVIANQKKNLTSSKEDADALAQDIINHDVRLKKIEFRFAELKQ